MHLNVTLDQAKAAAQKVYDSLKALESVIDPTSPEAKAHHEALKEMLDAFEAGIGVTSGTVVPDAGTGKN
jgi:hypothetical protein